MRLLKIFSLVTALLHLACTSPQERREMHRIIAEADSMNRHYVAFTTDTVLQRATAWYDRHGSNAGRAALGVPNALLAFLAILNN